MKSHFRDNSRKIENKLLIIRLTFFHSHNHTMSFADSFWTQDYELGFKILFDQLGQGVKENEDFVTLFTKRMELELLYGSQLESIEKSIIKSTSKRQANDDYVSSIKNAYQKINENFTKQGDHHLQIASNIKVLVLDPFSKWCKEHKQRVEFSETTIFEKHKSFKASKTSLDKLQKRYFNKCRMLEEFKSHYTEEELNEEMKDISFSEKLEKVDSEEEDTIYNFGNASYDHKTLKSLLVDMLKNIEIKSHKVSILGTYHNVSSGSSITQWLLDYMPEFNKNIIKAETFGQDLINNGFIRLIGSMGNKNFINSSQFYYQWKPIVFQITNLEGNTSESDLSRKSSLNVSSKSSTSLGASQFQDYFDDMKQAIGVNSVDYSDKSQLSKLFTEVNSLDAQYLRQTVELDKLRCEFEELIMDHLTFMQKCELDRLKAIKKVTFDFLSSFSSKIISMKQLCDELLVLEETINPVNDLKFLIENYSTGKFKPSVILYDNYYDSNINQTFGVDLNVKSRLDKRVVPIIVQCILSHLDKVYPDIVNDEERINLWTQPVHLTNIHNLRFELNDLNDPSKIEVVLSKTHPIIITNVLKLYFMELPESIIPYNYYDLIKSLYLNYPVNDDTKTDSRINGLQNVLIDLPKCNLATLDAILTHMNRLIQIIGSENEELAKGFQKQLSKEFGNLVLRPKFDSLSLDHSRSLINDKHQFNFLNDLFVYKDTIFKELRRRNSSRHGKNSNTSGMESREDSLNSRSAQTSGLGKSQPLTQKASVVASSKSRLESKLQNVVHKTKRLESENEVIGPNPSNIAASKMSVTPSTPPPVTPKKMPNSLKRSTSPNKKKLSSLLGEEKSLAKPQVVSSKPSKKDIVYDPSSSDSANSSMSDLVQPKFIASIGRKTSVKDLASKFDSPAPETPTKERSSSPTKRSSEKRDVIVVE